MITLAALVGAGFGYGMLWSFERVGLFAERSGVAVLLCAIAFFYPVFAAVEGDWIGLLLHGFVFLAFSALALRGFHTGMYLIAAGIIAHGFLDLVLIGTGASGPLWWPAFCAAIDIVFGAGLVRLLMTQKVEK